MGDFSSVEGSGLTQLNVHTSIRSWPRWWPLGIGLLSALIGVLYAGVLVRLVSDWVHDPNYSFGFIVVPFALFLVWHKRGTLMRLPVRPTWWGLIAIGGALAVFTVGQLGAELFLSRSSLILLLASLVLYFGGWRWLRALGFPLAFLLLMIPIPAIILNQVTLPLQFFASRVASSLLLLVGVPVVRDGNIIHLPEVTLGVTQACSGIRSLISLLSITIIYGYFFEPSPSQRAILAATAVPIAVVTNALRITGTGLLVEYCNPKWGTGFFHAFSGWLVFMMALFLLIAFHRALNFRGFRVSHA